MHMAEFHFSFSFNDQKLDDRQCKMKTDEMNFHMGPAKFHFLRKFLESPESIPTCMAGICRFCNLPFHSAIWKSTKLSTFEKTGLFVMGPRSFWLTWWSKIYYRYIYILVLKPLKAMVIIRFFFLMKVARLDNEWSVMETWYGFLTMCWGKRWIWLSKQQILLLALIWNKSLCGISFRQA